MEEIASTIREAKIDDQKLWDKTVFHPLQSWAWGQFRHEMGTTPVRRLLYTGNTVKDAWQLTFHSIAHTPWTVGYLPKGPQPTDEMLTDLIELGKKRNAIFIQLEPNVSSNYKLQISNFKLLRPSHHPLFTKFTFVLDLTLSEEELLKNMHPKTRYNIRVAQKYGVTISEDSSPEAFEEYIRLSDETTNRQGFYAHNRIYHERMWKEMHTNGIAKLFTATYAKTIIAAWIVFIWKDTLYYPYGASSRTHREVMAPTLMLWETAIWGKRHGLKYYDLWGALSQNPETNDPFYGFHRFKEGFHPKHVEFVGSYDLVIQPQLYACYKVADQLRWWWLKNKKR